MLLNVLASVIQETQGQRTHLTTDEMMWVKKLDGATEGIGHFALYLLAREYIRRTQRGEGTHELDHWIAFEPWDEPHRPEESVFGEERYDGAVQNGWVKSFELWNEPTVSEEGGPE